MRSLVKLCLPGCGAPKRVVALVTEGATSAVQIPIRFRATIKNAKHIRDTLDHAIDAVFEDTSVSEIFGGANQS